MFGFFKNKQDFEKEVQKEVDRREAERKAKVKEMWEEWEKENGVTIKFSKSQETKALYAKAEEAYKGGNPQVALDLLEKMIQDTEDLGEIVGLYVFILLVDVKKTLTGHNGAVEAYDRGIVYYSTHSGAYTERWLSDIQVLKDSYLQEEELILGMRERYSFDLTEENIIALKRLESIAVYRFIGYENLNSFDAVWNEVLKQVDYFENEEKGWNNLNKTTYKGAKNWLKSFSHLCSDEIPEEYRPKEG